MSFHWSFVVAGATLLVAVPLALVLGVFLARSTAVAVAALLLAIGAGILAVASVLAVETALIVSLVTAVLASLAVVYRIDRPGGRWGQHLRSRLAMGVPWGTLVVTLFVLSVYLFVQDGITNFNNPVVIPFRAWSYLYPTGVLTAAFAHGGPGHLIGNLVGTVVLGSIAEYAWGHFPNDRGSSSFGSLRSNPWVRALVVFPIAVVLVGVATAAFSIGPVIGFSGVVFAFAGFALTRYPLGTVVAVVGTDAVGTVYSSLQNPIVTATAQPSPPSPPWWAGIAIQGHALGLFVGIVLGSLVFSRRDAGPTALRLWTGVLLYGMTQALWAVYWFRGNETYVLYRGPGVVLVAMLALLVAAGISASTNPILANGSGESSGGKSRLRTTRADGGSDDRRDDQDATGSTIGTVETGGSDDDDGGLLSSLRSGRGDGGSVVSPRGLAIIALVLGLGLMAGPGLASNMFSVADQSPPGRGIAVGDYHVSYAENVENEMVSIIDVELFNETTSVETSGVIVTSPKRNIWQQAVSKGRLAFDGRVAIDVGGIGWRETVVAERRGWSAAGGPAAYKVWLTGPDGSRTLSFVSEPATAEPVIRGRNVSVVPTDETFALQISKNNSSIGAVRIPDPGNSSVAGGIRFVNREGTIFATTENGTRVKVATAEEYE